MCSLYQERRKMGHQKVSQLPKFEENPTIGRPVIKGLRYFQI